MIQNKLIKRLLSVSAVVAMCGAFTAQAQTAETGMQDKSGMKKPPVTGEVNDQTSPNAVQRPAGKPNSTTDNANPGVVPPKVGEPNDPTSPNAVERPAPMAKSTKHKSKNAKVKPPVTGEANDQTAPGGTTEAAKAAKEAKPSDK